MPNTRQITLAALLARVRKTAASAFADNVDKAPEINHRGDLITANGLPERSELVRLGRSYYAAIPTASAFTYVAAWPTTRAELILSNGEAAGGKTYIIDRVWLHNITSQAAAMPIELLAQISPADSGVTAATDNSAVLRGRLDGQTLSYGGKGRLAIANTAFMVSNRWTALAGKPGGVTTTLGQTVAAEVYGRYLIPPGGAFGLAGVAGSAAGTAIAGIEWHEVQL